MPASNRQAGGHRWAVVQRRGRRRRSGLRVSPRRSACPPPRPNLGGARRGPTAHLAGRGGCGQTPKLWSGQGACYY
eukprot:7867953-Pyramimonas_sp.AAC.1